MKQFTQTEKARRGWWASVVFMLLIVSLIIFLSYVKVVEENRDILVGIIGMLTGSISGMLAIASGRDPSELDELKEELASKNADREALIARLRDAQIQMQLLRDQVFELQLAIINKLSVFQGENPIKTLNEDQVVLKDVVDQWTPKSETPETSESSEVESEEILESCRDK
jgi:hypothetical protein